MELLNRLYNLMGLVFVLGTIISMGLSLTMMQITAPLRNSRFVMRVSEIMCKPKIKLT
jgi:hypothetical protein